MTTTGGSSAVRTALGSDGAVVASATRGRKPAGQGDAVVGSPMAGFWTVERIAEALGDGPADSRAIRAITTDTRAIGKGDAFVALRGERFDAHDFLAEAVAKGAAALVVSRAEAAHNLGVPVFVVPDTLVALGQLARYRRRAWGQGKIVVGVTGTNGKTSTKDLIRAALASRLEVHATDANLNNLVGLPLTLLAVPDSADVIVAEMGTNMPGEIGKLRAIAEPDVAVVTSVAEGHLEGLGDLGGVLREKVSIFAGAQVAIAPSAQPEIADGAASLASRVVTAGLDGGEYRPDLWGIESDGLGWLEIEGVTVRPRMRGTHSLRNAMLALAVARECGIPLSDAAAGIDRMPAPPMRLAVDEIGSALLINDAYNANPGSTRAALELLEAAGGGRQRVAVLGTMRELGSHSPRLHAEIAREALRSSIEVLAGVGEAGDALRAEGLGDERVVFAPDVDELWALLEPRLKRDAMILLKGSRGVRLERLVPHLTAWAAR
jgi:UDP-N-acetylmuramoyl-tripeptide--D-alanyl-D-alanine ligase